MEEQENDKDVNEVRIDLGEGDTQGRDPWADALAELEKSRPAKKQPSKKPTPATEKPAPEKEQKAPPSEDKPIEELEAALAKVQSTHGALEKFIKEHPYLVAPNIFQLMEEHLRETIHTMQRECEKLDQGQGE